MLNIFKLIIIFLINNTSGVLFPYNIENDNKQTLIIKYYSSPNCLNNNYDNKSYNGTCSQIQTFTSCCNNILKKHKINKTETEINICYTVNKFKYYKYECNKYGFVPIEYDFWMLIIFYSLLGIIFLKGIIIIYKGYYRP